MLKAQESDSFDLGPDWFELLVRSALPDGFVPAYYVLWRDDQPRCVFPVFTTNLGVTSQTNFYTSLFRPALAEQVKAIELVPLIGRMMADTKAPWIRLDAMDPAHPSFAVLLSALSLAGLSAHRFFAFGNWYLPSRDLAFDDYLQGLKSRVRNTLMRRQKKFHADGKGRTEIFVCEASVHNIVDAWQSVYAASWKRPEPYPAFVPELVRLCAQRGWLRMGIAYLGDTPIAAQLWIVNAGRAAIYKLAYHEKFRQYSAGTILTAEMIAYVLQKDRVHEVDYLIGDDAYKKDWMSRRRQRCGVIAFNLRTLKGLSGAALQYLGDAKRRFAKLMNRAGDS